ncbi:hypothetical protein [Puia sp.]|jgi:hypothetical protein|uniref:hypothetical protein n=1 Tax=Puia sp. TaxID=2045100 RepID=UPI002F407C7B
MKFSVTLIRAVTRNLYVLTFLNGFLLAALLCFKIQAAYENGLFASIKSSINLRTDANDNADSIVVKSMDVCYYLMQPRAATFNDNTVRSMGLEASLFRSTAVDLMTASGACGSYSQVLARIIDTYHYPVRIAQMKANGYFGAHNIVEVYTGSRWVVLDPTFNLYFTRPDGRLASFEDVHGNWNYYSQQLPDNYDRAYKYEDVRYTNWTKVPVIMPAIKNLLSLCFGKERVNGFSLRTHFMNTYMVCFNIFLFLEIGLLLATIKRMFKTHSWSFSRYFDVGLGQNKI